jgi:23S rRNA (cytidine1920-2'-O)/16S rRNA (cytidine1409-2'-O)-methyltransferase
VKNGAASVTAVDVGYGQLAWSLRNDSRVTCMERTNIRYVKPADIGELKDFSVMDVSFISLKKVLPVVKDLINDSGEVVCLVKPQFEAGREKVGKHGVVKEPETHMEVLDGIVTFAIGLGFIVKGLTYSPIKGPEGNIEYLLYISKTGRQSDDVKKLIDDVVNLAHGNL